MADEEQDMIAKHNMYLLYHLRPSVKRIIKYLHEEQVILPQDTEKILSQAADTMKTQHLLNKLREIGKSSMDYLYAASLFTKSWPAADVLYPKNKPHKEKEEQEPLPGKWPSNDHFKSLSKNTLVVKDVEKKNTKMKEYFDNPNKFNVYEMDKKIKGRALIINNYKFIHLKDRQGTEMDQKGLELILEALNFDVKVAEDLTAKEMEAMLKVECKEDHSKYNCFILVILSHGGLGIVYGKDGLKGDNTTYLETDEIMSAFSKVESLAKKPKLFIIQACRGREEAEMVSSQTARAGHGVQDEEQEEDEDEELDPIEKMDQEEGGEKDADTHSPHMDQPQQSTSVLNLSTGATPSRSNLNDSVRNTTQDDTKDQESSEDEDDGDSSDEDDAGELDTDKHKQPLENTEDLTEGKPLHFLIAMPTTEGNVSWRNKYKGSWFIQAFIYVLANYAYREDLYTLMVKVNELVRRAGGRQSAEVPEFETTLIKRLYFFPGLEKAVTQ